MRKLIQRIGRTSQIGATSPGFHLPLSRLTKLRKHGMAWWRKPDQRTRVDGNKGEALAFQLVRQLHCHCEQPGCESDHTAQSCGVLRAMPVLAAS